MADVDEIVDAFIKGIPVILIGFLISYFSVWSKSDDDKSKNEGSNIGCFGVLLMGIGFLMLIPLWTWVEAIAISAYSVILILAIVVGIIVFVYDKLKS